MGPRKAQLKRIKRLEMPDHSKQQSTTRHLYAYWNDVRNKRVAPRRFEIEPMKIATLLPETFIVECKGLHDFRFRLAGTRLCENFGQELRGQGLLDFWQDADREVLREILNRIVFDADIGTVVFDSITDDNRTVRFEMLLLPLIHNGASINRVMGSITAVDAPLWLGSRALVRHAIVETEVFAPANDGGLVAKSIDLEKNDHPAMIVQQGDRRFRVYEGGRPDEQPDT